MRTVIENIDFLYDKIIVICSVDIDYLEEWDMKHINFEMINEIKNKDDFISFIKKYVISDENNFQLNEYLESVISWVEDMEGFFRNIGQKQPDSIDWSFISTLFYVGKIYE